MLFLMSATPLGSLGELSGASDLSVIRAGTKYMQLFKTNPIT